MRMALGALPVALAMSVAGVATADPGTSVNALGPLQSVSSGTFAHKLSTVARPIPPLWADQLHLPHAQAVVAPILAPWGTLRFGDLVLPMSVLSQQQLDAINGAAAGQESQISTFARSVGVTPQRAASIASATVAGAVVGGVLTCAGFGLLLIASVVLIPLLPLDCAKDLVLGSIPGAAVGAVVGATR